MNTASYITYYNREGRIYTNFSRTDDKYCVFLNYYDIRKGCPVFVDRQNIIGSMAKLVKLNIELVIIDVDNTSHGMFANGNVKNIRLKVKAKDGSSGWIERMNGGD